MTVRSDILVQCIKIKSFSSVIFIRVDYFFFHNCIFGYVGSYCCTWAFSSCGEQGLLFTAVCGLLILVAPLVVEHRL